MRAVIGAIFLAALAACAPLQPQASPTAPATDVPQAGLPNPATVYCRQNGNKLAPSADGDPYGLCVFPDGSACGEWAYFRGECCPAGQPCPAPAMTAEGGNTQQPGSGGYMPPGSTDVVADWWGVIKSTEPGAQYDDYFERQDLGQSILFGIDSADPAVEAQIETLRDSGKLVHLYGTLLSNVPDHNGSQIKVERIEVGE